MLHEPRQAFDVTENRYVALDTADGFAHEDGHDYLVS